MYHKISEVIKSTVIEFETAYRSKKFWKEPIIEIIAADNKNLFLLRETVSDEHLMPHNILEDAKSIISFFIPFHENIINSNINGKTASPEWAAAYIKTNELIQKINDNVEILMEQNGYKTGKIPATHNFYVEKLISNWSHRHIAYIAGIGTFGINNMLITKSGCCGRLGSIIINCELNEYKKTGILKEKCINKLNGSCGICQKNCISNAYENNIFNRFKCYNQCLENAERHKNIGYADVCGKCLVGLPCSVKEPEYQGSLL